MEFSGDKLEFVEIKKSEPGLLEKMGQKKEKAQKKRRLQSISRLLSREDFFHLAVNSTTGEAVLFGDLLYKPNILVDSRLDLVFSALGINERDSNLPLTTSSLRERGENIMVVEEHKFASESSGVVAKIVFLNEGIKYNLELQNVGEKEKRRLLSALESHKPIKWAERISERIDLKTDEIVKSEDQSWIISLDEFKEVAVDEDLLYFVLGCGFGSNQAKTTDDLKNMINGGDGEVKIGKDGFYLRLVTKKDQNEEQPVVEVAVEIKSRELGASEVEKDFLRSKTSEQVLAVLDEAGLTLSDGLTNDFSEGLLGYGHFNERYGNGYVSLTRSLSYLVGRPPGVVQEAIFGGKVDKDRLEAIRQNIEKVGQPAKLVLEMMLGLCDEDKDRANHINFPYQRSGLSMNDGSCKDSEAYYCGAFNNGQWSEDGVFIYKNIGARTAITKMPIFVNGVRLPAGFLCRVGPDGIEPLRATMFCFDSADVEDAFQWQYSNIISEPRLRLSDRIDWFSKKFRRKGAE